MSWVITTDLGLDDQISLLALAKAALRPNSNITIKAILADGNGLAHAFPAKTNAVRLLRFAGIAKEKLPPVGTGSSDSLEGFNQYPAPWRYDEDNLRGAMLPEYKDEVQAQNKSSTALLKGILTTSPDKISLLSIGTFTTLAQVLSDSPHLAKKIDKIVCMAGAVKADGNLHRSLNKVSEFNAWIDPVATQMVFESGIPITMVPLDATSKARLTQSFVDRFRAKTSGPVAKQVADWWQGSLNKPLGEYYHWDPLATAIAFNPDIITNAKVERIAVNASLRVGRQPFNQPYGDISYNNILNWKGKARQPLNTYTAGATKISSSRNAKPINVVYDANIPLFEETMINVFSAAPPSSTSLQLLGTTPLNNPAGEPNASALI